jgi:hypothetical protein
MMLSSPAPPLKTSMPPPPNSPSFPEPPSNWTGRVTFALTAATSSPLPSSRRTESMPPSFGQSTQYPSGLAVHPPSDATPPNRVKRMDSPVS